MPVHRLPLLTSSCDRWPNKVDLPLRATGWPDYRKSSFWRGSLRALSANKLAFMAAGFPGRAGATEIVATDVMPHPLRKVLQVGADEAINMAEQPDALDRYTADKGHFDVLFERARSRWPAIAHRP